MPFWIVAAVNTSAGKQGPWWHDGCCFKNCAGQPTSSIIETAMLWAWKTSAPLLRQSQGCRLQSSQPSRLNGQNEQGRCFEREVPAACLREWFARAIPCTHEGQKKFWDFSHFFPKMKPLRMYPRCEGSEAHPLSRKPGHGSGVILKAMVSLRCMWFSPTSHEILPGLAGMHEMHLAQKHILVIKQGFSCGIGPVRAGPLRWLVQIHLRWAISTAWSNTGIALRAGEWPAFFQSHEILKFFFRPSFTELLQKRVEVLWVVEKIGFVVVLHCPINFGKTSSWWAQ